MATNFVQPGNRIIVTTPTGGLSSGDPVQVGQLFGVALADYDAGDDAVILTQGVFTLPKDASAPTQGAAAYWDVSAGKVSTSDDSGVNSLIGTFTEAVATGVTTAKVLLIGTAIG